MINTILIEDYSDGNDVPELVVGQNQLWSKQLPSSEQPTRGMGSFQCPLWSVGATGEGAETVISRMTPSTIYTHTSSFSVQSEN